ncbi:SynChlorMet cassette radical SAM/SPASM protein [Desulfonema limicola]|uniref:SynChlorMet cassette radical SAM/SPASM protein n=1 Tax=Desulfonema limicola TaxID=45656 RepID=A0A975GFJ7_9BACT|nr:SynChlorMet cassette radical SAM/SPASM protein [Desulfonema limicola]
MDYPLNQLYCYLTQGCNLACCHCWLEPGFEGNGDHYPVLDVKLFEQALNEAVPLGLTSVKLTGGEPLMHPEFFDILKIIKNKNLALVIETNGILCTPGTASKIAQLPVQSVSVSIDSPDPKTHDKIRGVAGAFEKSCKAVKNLSTCSIHPQIIMSLMSWNIHQIEEMVRLGEKLGASSIKFNIVQPVARGEKLVKAGKGVSIETIIKTGHYVETILAKKTRLSLIFDYPAAFRPLSCIFSAKSCYVCGILGILGIIPDGSYALCGIGQHIPDLVFGKAGTDSLEHIWKNNHILEALRKGLPEKLEGVCSRCLMKYQCLGACIAQNYYTSNSLWSGFWFCEQAYQSGLFPETRLK